jgi:hypothetical protein
MILEKQEKNENNLNLYDMYLKIKQYAANHVYQ